MYDIHKEDVYIFIPYMKFSFDYHQEYHYSLFNTDNRNKLAIGENYGVNFLYYSHWLSEHRKRTLFSCTETDINRSFSKFEE